MFFAKRRFRDAFVLSSFLVGLVIVSACDDKRRHSASEGVQVTPASSAISPQATAKEVAAAMMKALADAQHARAQGLGTEQRKQEYDLALASIWGLTDRKSVHQIARSSKSQTMPRDVTEDAAVTLVTESWISLTAHYVDGFDLEHVTVTPEPAVDQAQASIPAENPVEREMRGSLEKELLSNPPKGDDGAVLSPQSSEYANVFRKKALERGFNVPTVARMTLELTRQSEGWRVKGVSINPSRGQDWVSSQPTKLPGA